MKPNTLCAALTILFVVGCGGPSIRTFNHIGASLASVTLANDCPNAPKVSADFVAGACAPDSNCFLCRQSSMQLAFTSSPTSPTRAAKVEIRAVRLLDGETKRVLQTLTAREPQKWADEKYVAWDQIVPASGELKASYKLSAPSFSYDTDARLGYRKYIVEVDVAIDEEIRTLQVEATREPEVST